MCLQSGATCGSDAWSTWWSTCHLALPRRTDGHRFVTQRSGLRSWHASLSADRYTLRRFLRARSHNVAKALQMFKAHLEWRREFGTDDLDKFHFHERDAFISLYPQGYHMTDKLVGQGVL